MESIDIRVSNHDVTLGNTSIECIAEVDGMEVEYWWSFDEGLIPKEFDGPKIDELSWQQYTYLEKWSAAAHKLVFAGYVDR